MTERGPRVGDRVRLCALDGPDGEAFEGVLGTIVRRDRGGWFDALLDADVRGVWEVEVLRDGFEVVRHPDHRNPAAVALGHLGGTKGGPARAAALSRERRQDIARKAASVRWANARQRGEGGE